eukprot:7856142-Heterocapsa_arctica.AAC.1
MALSAPVYTIVVPDPDDLHVFELVLHVDCEEVVVRHIADQHGDHVERLSQSCSRVASATGSPNQWDDLQ